ncbi:sporulation-specific protein 22 [Elasticomyces elasticus]|nr:sporulation-specific protein 22 [Elasticomyces elasticus]
MATKSFAKKQKDRRVTDLINSICKRVATASEDRTLSAELQSHINHDFPIPHSAALVAHATVLDGHGTQLWNLATRMRHGDGVSARPEAAETICLLRVFALLLLHTSHQCMRHTGKSRTPNGAPEQELRVLKVATKAARFCLDNAQIGLCQKVVEYAADYVGEGAVIDTTVSDGLGCNNKDRGLLQQLSTEYYILRTTIAWRQGRLDLAEHMYKKAATSGEVLAEKQADLLFEIGKDLLKGKDFVLATKWLERALNALAEQEIEKLGPDAGELKLGIVHSLVRALIGVKNTESKVKAWDMVNLLENDFGNKMVTLLLRLELLAEADPFDAEEYFTALLRLMRTVLLTETNFQSIMHHVHELKDHQSSELACKALDEFIVTRLCEPTSTKWLEKATITRIWIGTSGTTDEVAFLPLSKNCDSIAQNYANPFSAQATHAAQTVSVHLS